MSTSAVRSGSTTSGTTNSENPVGLETDPKLVTGIARPLLKIEVPATRTLPSVALPPTPGGTASIGYTPLPDDDFQVDSGAKPKIRYSLSNGGEIHDFTEEEVANLTYEERITGQYLTLSNVIVLRRGTVQTTAVPNTFFNSDQYRTKLIVINTGTPKVYKIIERHYDPCASLIYRDRESFTVDTNQRYQRCYREGSGVVVETVFVVSSIENLDPNYLKPHPANADGRVPSVVRRVLPSVDDKKGS